MKILIVGSGAREHAITVALQRSAAEPSLYCCGTSLNPGIRELCQDYWVGSMTDLASVMQQAKNWGIELAIIGPEAPLEKGLADILWENNIPTIGPTQALAQIETSKGFARDLMQRYQISGLPRYQTFQSMQGIDAFLQSFPDQGYVIKANGLMGGKGVKVAGEHLHSIEEAQAFCAEILNQHQSILIEEKLIGQEFSLMCFCDGEHVIPMPIVQDHKRAFVNDQGPNTGGMGSYSDVNHSLPFLTEQEVAAALQINRDIIEALQNETHEKYIGVLYGSFIATTHGVFVIEFNARFGDPESLNVLSILVSDFVELCQAWVSGTLQPNQVIFAPLATVCKYAVPHGYPDQPLKNAVIDIGEIAVPAKLYLAAVDWQDDQLVATGSRTAACVGVAQTIAHAERMAEKAIQQIHGPVFHREDIGTSALIQQRIDMMQRLRIV